MYLNGDLTYLQMPLFYGFDAEAFHQDCDALKARGMTEITQDLTGLSGTVEVEEGEAVLFTSLPADLAGLYGLMENKRRGIRYLTPF